MKLPILFLAAVSVFSADKTSELFLPLRAFGFTENQNITIRPEYRLNSTQTPQTNRFQIYQARSSTSQGLDPTLTYSTPFNRGICRIGPYEGTLGLTGPGIIWSTEPSVDFSTYCIDETTYAADPQGELCTTEQLTGVYAGFNLPTITDSATTSLIFNAAELGAGGFDVANITTTLDAHGISLQTEYNLPGEGSMTDYVIMGNVFHDVYYSDLIPRLISDFTLNDTVDVVIDGTSSPWTLGDTLGPGTKFQFQFTNPDASNQAILVIYAENSGNTPISLDTTASGGIIMTATAKYTGWIRAVLFTEDQPMVTVGGSICVPDTGQIVDVPGTSGPETTTLMLNPVWFTALQVQAIAQIPLSFYSLFPSDWIADVNRQIMVQQSTAGDPAGGDIQWQGPFNGQYLFGLSSSPTTLLLPFLAYDDARIDTGANPTLFDHATAILGGSSPLQGVTTYTEGYGTSGASYPLPPSVIGDTSASLFTTAFWMGMTHGQATNMDTFKSSVVYNSTGQPLPVYAADNTSVSDMAMQLDAFRSAIPTSVSDVTFTDSTVTYTYKLSSDNSGTSQTTAPLICFPAWMLVQNETPIDFVFKSAIKGNLFCFGATGGSITIEEKDWSSSESWITNGDFLPSTDLDTLFGTDTPAMNVIDWLTDIYQTEAFSWLPGDITIAPPIVLPSVVWPTQRASDGSLGGYVQPSTPDAPTLLGGYGTGKALFQLVNTAILMDTFLKDQQSVLGITDQDIKDAVEPLIDFVKRELYDFFLYRPIDQDYFVPDSTNHGLCFGGNPVWDNSVSPPNSNFTMVQQAQGNIIDFGNGFYNDHVLQFNYYLQSAARIIQYDNTAIATAADRWINQRILGADQNIYSMRHFVDLLWRDILNFFPATEDNFPYLRSFNLWEGHPEALGMAYPPPAIGGGSIYAVGQSLESIAEAYLSLSGAYYYAINVINDGSITSNQQQQIYEPLRDTALMLMKMTVSSSRVLWFLRDSGYTTSSMGAAEPSFFDPNYLNYVLTTGAVDDNKVTTSVAFPADVQSPLGTCP